MTVSDKELVTLEAAVCNCITAVALLETNIIYCIKLQFYYLSISPWKLVFCSSLATTSSNVAALNVNL